MTFFVLFLDGEGLQKNSQTSPFRNPIIKSFENQTNVMTEPEHHNFLKPTRHRCPIPFLDQMCIVLFSSSRLVTVSEVPSKIGILPNFRKTNKQPQSKGN